MQTADFCCQNGKIAAKSLQNHKYTLQTAVFETFLVHKYCYYIGEKTGGDIMMILTKDKIRFFDALRKTLLAWSVVESEADEFMFQIAQAELEGSILLDGVKYNLSRWGVGEQDRNDFIKHLKHQLRDKSQTVCEDLQDTQAAVLLDNGLVMSFHSAK